MSRSKLTLRSSSLRIGALLLSGILLFSGVVRADSTSTPACAGVATASVANTTAAPIPDNNPTGVTSTIVVSGATGTIWDVDLTTAITHTFAADLDITLTSPAGTVVTISTDNGAANDNVYNGTFWDDSADPDSQIPYAVNPSIATDHTYTNLVAATPLTPEEPLAAFFGEDPNGTWTLKIVDDSGLDTGTLNSWGLDFTLLTTPIVTSTTTSSNTTAAPIPDNNPTGVTSTITVSGAGPTLTDVNLTTAITHTFASDLDVTLTSPAGTTVTITTGNGTSNDNVFNGTVWDDSADPGSQIPYTGNPNIVTDHTYTNLVPATTLTPEEPLGAFIGQDPNGTWTLKVVDHAGGDSGTLNSWGMDLTTAVCAADLGITKTDGITSATPGQAVTYTIVASNSSAANVTGATVADTFSASLTAVSWTCIASSGSSCGASGSGDISDTVNLLAGGTATYTVHATVSLSASGSVSNTATVSVPASVTDTVPGNDSSSDTDTITAPASSADLAVTEIGPPTITPGGHLAFLVTITNNGPDAAQNVVLSGSLPAGTVLFSQSELTGPSFTLGGTSTSINDPIATLAAGASATFRIILLVSPSVPIGTILSDTVTVSASTTDAVTENDTATATVLVAAVSVPTLSPLGALGLAITLLGVGMFLIRQRF